jgi:hypothetical protein
LWRWSSVEIGLGLEQALGALLNAQKCLGHEAMPLL